MKPDDLGVPRPALGVLMALSVAACGGGSPMSGMTRPGQGGGAGTLMMAVSPVGNSTQVPVTSPIVVTFSSSMASGMEQYVDLHEGDVSGPTVPMTCSWSGNRTTLTCHPVAPLAPQILYTIHIGGGLKDANGRVVDLEQYRSAVGGQWIMAGMMGSTHAGMPMGALSAGWLGSNGSYGLAIAFTSS